MVKHGGGTPSSTHTTSVPIPGHITTAVEMVSGWTIRKSLAGVPVVACKGRCLPGGRTNVTTFTSTAFHHLATGGRATWHSVDHASGYGSESVIDGHPLVPTLSGVLVETRPATPITPISVTTPVGACNGAEWALKATTFTSAASLTTTVGHLAICLGVSEGAKHPSALNSLNPLRTIAAIVTG